MLLNINDCIVMILIEVLQRQEFKTNFVFYSIGSRATALVYFFQVSRSILIQFNLKLFGKQIVCPTNFLMSVV